MTSKLAMTVGFPDREVGIVVRCRLLLQRGQYRMYRRNVDMYPILQHSRDEERRAFFG